MSSFLIFTAIALLLLVLLFFRKKDNFTDNEHEFENKFREADFSRNEEEQDEIKAAIRKIKANLMSQYLKLRGNADKKTSEIISERISLVPALLGLSKELVYKNSVPDIFYETEAAYNNYKQLIDNSAGIENDKSYFSNQEIQKETEFDKKRYGARSELGSFLDSLVDDIVMTGIFNTYYAHAG